jgi:hypothetical protein
MNQFLNNMNNNKIKINKMMNLTHKMKIKKFNKLTITMKKRIN